MDDKVTKRAMLDSREEEILAEISGGKAQVEIAAELGCAVSKLNEWLHGDAERSARARAAMHQSAETWLDRGLVALRDAECDPSEIARARAIEQHCARRAAIRDPARYADKAALALSGALSVTVRATTVSDDELAAIAKGAG